jgi:hypothetical protein
MLISDEHLDKFIVLLEKKTGKKINRADALESAIKLVTLVEAIYKPMTKEDLKKLNERRNETKDK